MVPVSVDLIETFEFLSIRFGLDSEVAARIRHRLRTEAPLTFLESNALLKIMQTCGRNDLIRETLEICLDNYLFRELHQIPHPQGSLRETRRIPSHDSVQVQTAP